MEIIFDYDGDGDIDEFDEEMAEYELQLMEDEIFLRENIKGKTKIIINKRIRENRVVKLFLLRLDF